MESREAVGSGSPLRGGTHADRVRRLAERRLADFPWQIRFRDWTGQEYAVGRGDPHWSGRSLDIVLRSPAAARRILAYDAMGFLEKYLEGEADLEGNLYLLADLRRHARFGITAMRAIPSLLLHRAFQNRARSRANVKSHYDIPQEALEVYLDRVYLSYSCAMFEHPEDRGREGLVRAGEGEADDFDSLEKAQWRKFKDAIDFIRPAESDTILDVGCGYGGQLRVALENHKFRKYVGWTHSANQVRKGSESLLPFDPTRWELLEGDYRNDDRVYDHVTSTGMVSHVGPRGLVPYVRNIRRRMKGGGRYLHHCLMRGWSPLPLDFHIGPAFNKRYVWPGFHWFTLGDHVRALERNGFQVLGGQNLARHYAKTTSAWYERMMMRADVMRAVLGEPTFRAWRVFLAGVTGNFLNNGAHVYRLYCEAV
jgi:cyclopropane-fatty-acyl-phospholipid synthase